MRVVGIALLIALGWLGPAAAGDLPPDLQGRWDLVAIEIDGKDYPMTEGQPRCEVVGDRMRYGGEEIAVLTADAGAMPKSVDFRFVPKDRTFEGIYERRGETLRVCLNRRSEGVKERPHRLSTRGHENWRLLVFRRATSAEGDAPGFVGLALGVDEAKGGVVVEDLLEDTPAAKSGLKMGDVLLAVDGAEVAGLKEAITAVRRGKPGQTLAIRVRRDGEPKEIKVRVGVMPFTLLTDLE